MAAEGVALRQRIRRDPWLWTAVAVGGILAATAATLSLLRFHTLGNDNFDIAFYTRVVWGMAHGDRVNPILNAHDLGLHLMPIMWIFVPLAYLLPIPDTLLVAQSLALGAVAPLLFRLGRRITGRPCLGVGLAVAWALHPAALQIGCREFHPGTLALPFLVAAFDALHARRLRAGGALLFVACLTREDVSLVAAGAGGALCLTRGLRWAGGGLAAAGVAWFLGYALLIQPAYLPASGAIEAHFSDGGHTVGQVLSHLISHPSRLAERLFSVSDITYMLTLLLILAGLPLLGARWLLAALPPLMINLLSSFRGILSLSSHYVTLVLPPLFMAAAVGMGRITERYPGRRPRYAMVGLLLATSLAAHVLWGASPLGRGWSAAPYTMDRDEGILAWYAREIVRHPELSVTAPSAALNHLAERRRAYSVAFEHPRPDVAILVIRGRQWVSLSPERYQKPMEREIQRLDRDPAYGTWRFNPPFRVAWRGKRGGAERLAALSPGALPDAAVPQGGWPGVVALAGLEARLNREREAYSGRYEKQTVIRATFYWRASRPLPPSLLVKAVIKGTTKTHVRYLLPTRGMRDTATWKPGEIIRDEQRLVSPGGWPIDALAATIQFVGMDDETPYPPGASPIALKWR